MTPPEGLQFDYVTNIGFQQLVVVTLITTLLTSSVAVTFESFCALIPPAQPLQLRRLTIHIELGMLAIFAHAVRAIRCTVTHLKFKFVLYYIYELDERNY